MKLDLDNYRIVDTDGIDDCAECYFGSICNITCRLPQGFHYEERTYL